MGCIFCDIVAGKIPGDIVHSDDDVLAFRDIKPQSPVHLLIVPVRHYTSLLDITEKESPLMGHMVTIANRLARSEGIADAGYRIVVNCGQQGGQLVQHLHMHVLGGRQLSGTLG
jgi:histidine triad (HIT) family protein